MDKQVMMMEIHFLPLKYGDDIFRRTKKKERNLHPILSLYLITRVLYSSFLSRLNFSRGGKKDPRTSKSEENLATVSTDPEKTRKQIYFGKSNVF